MDYDSQRLVIEDFKTLNIFFHSEAFDLGAMLRDNHPPQRANLRPQLAEPVTPGPRPKTASPTVTPAGYSHIYVGWYLGTYSIHCHVSSLICIAIVFQFSDHIIGVHDAEFWESTTCLKPLAHWS